MSRSYNQFFHHRFLLQITLKNTPLGTVRQNSEMSTVPLRVYTQ